MMAFTLGNICNMELKEKKYDYSDNLRRSNDNELDQKVFFCIPLKS